MFLPANTRIKCTLIGNQINRFEQFTCMVREIPFDFDPEGVNGIKVLRENRNKEEYIDDINYRIEVMKLPDEYFIPNKFYFILRNKLDGSFFFCTDGIYQNNRWIGYQMNLIEKVEDNQSYREAYRYYKSKYLISNGN